MFDSGLGGLSVARRVIDRLPSERILYFADTAHVPYGERPLDQIREFALGITGFLIERGAKAVVMACNMSSAVALDAARQAYPDIPIIGVIEPGAMAAAGIANGAPIGVLATTGTIRSEAYVRAVAAIRSIGPRDRPGMSQVRPFDRIRPCRQRTSRGGGSNLRRTPARPGLRRDHSRLHSLPVRTARHRGRRGRRREDNRSRGGNCACSC